MKPVSLNRAQRDLIDALVRHRSYAFFDTLLNNTAAHGLVYALDDMVKQAQFELEMHRDWCDELERLIEAVAHPDGT